MLQNIIQKHKQFIAIVCILISFLFIHNFAYCDLSFFQKWYYNNIENYFLNLTWEKAISDPIQLSKSVGWVSISAIGSLYVFEGIWNARLLGSKFLYKFTPLGHLDDISGKGASWLGFRNTSGPLKQVIDTVPYEEILPLYWARNYVFPYIFIKPNTNRITSRSIESNHIINNTNNSNIAMPETNSIAVQADLGPIIIRENVDRPVYQTVYRDRENLASLDQKVNALVHVGNDLLFLQTHNKTRQELIEEINLLRQHEEAPTFTLPKLNKIYRDFNMSSVTDEIPYSFIPLKLNRLMFKRQQGEIVMSFVDNSTNSSTVSLSMDSFKESCPQIYATLLYMDNNKSMFDTEPYILLKYTEQRSFFNSSFNLDVPNCKVSTGGGNFYSLLDKIEEIQLQSLQAVNTEFNSLTTELKEKITNEQRLINIETKDQSTQTMEFSLNDMLYDRINLYLEIRDETSFAVASREGQNLSFNDRNAANVQAGIEAEKRRKAEKEQRQSNNNEMSIQTENPVVSTQTVVQENTNQPAIIDGLNIDIFSSMSTITQNPFMVFAIGLSVFTANNFHNIELAAQSLAGFAHIQGFEDTLQEAWRLSVEDLKTTYNLSQSAAEKAREILGRTFELRYPETSATSSGHEYTNNGQLPWNKIMYVGGVIVGVIGVLGISYLYYQSIKTGTYITGNNIQNISPSVEAWKNAYFDKINKL